jgi:hypothetical protein
MPTVTAAPAPPAKPAAAPIPARKKAIDYRHYGRFDRKIFLDGFRKACRGRPMGASAESDVLQLLGFMEGDVNVWDIRWMAYMLATVMKETTHPEAREVRVLDNKGNPVLDKNGQPVTRTEKPWVVTMNPVAEVGHGKGRRYHLPVKVAKAEGGDARVTEYDGDVFSVSPAGVIRPVTKKATQGADAGSAATKSYQDAEGDELAYYGRGYVQLTWWSNYVKAGIALEMGLDLLFDPELAREPRVAYALMSHGMRTGFGFANGRTFAKYFSGSNTNYVGARAMVNGTDSAAEIAAMAKKFEAALMAAKL